jgi:hypothetical protein
LRWLKLGSVVDSIEKATGNQELHEIFLFGTVVIFRLFERHKTEIYCKFYCSRCFAFTAVGEIVRWAQEIINVEDFTRK